MRKRIALFFVKLADKIYRTSSQMRVPNLTDYVPTKVGIAFDVTANDVRKYRKHHEEENLSLAEAKRRVMDEVKNEIVLSIMKSLVDNGAIKFDSEKRIHFGREIVRCSGELKVYVPKDKYVDIVSDGEEEKNEC